jgi:O-antigen polysaccharide polymerase Wzy
MLIELLIWVALLVGLVYLVADKRTKRGALTLSYFLILSLGHVPGVLAYLDPGWGLWSAEATKVGFDTTLIGMTTFCVGAAVAAWMLPPRLANAKAYQQVASAEFFSGIGWRMLTIGIVAYFIVLPVAAEVPSVTAIASVTALLLILGFWLRLYEADRRRTLLILLTTPLLPLSTLVTGGFIGFSTAWILTIVAFYFVMARRHIWFYLAAPPIIFLGLSLFVTYSQARKDIREAAWDKNTTMLERLDKVTKMFIDFQFLDLSNELHQNALNDRLNQNYLVGFGVMRHREYGTELSYGATVSVWALIPRAIWPDKPAVGGGQDLVTQFTGISFAEGTSVGVGQVLEFYMNFGMPGVLVGFAVLGFILMRLDQQTMCGLATRNISHVMRWALPGLALLSPLGNLLEILVTFVSAMIVSQLLIYSNLLGSGALFAENASTKMSG